MEYNLADLFESVADAVADRDALVIGDRRLTFAELDERANRAAHCLAAQGIGPGDHVGLYLGNCTPYIEAMLGCFKLRAVPININYRYVEEELRYLLDDADIACLIYGREFAPRVEAVLGSMPKLRITISVEDGSDASFGSLDSIDYEQAIAAASPDRDFAPRSGSDLFLLYTGGTTGMPKGVMWTHEDLFFAGLMGANPSGPPPESAEQVAERAAARPSLAMMSAAPLIHGAAQLGSFIALLSGSKAVLADRFDPVKIWQTIADEQVISLSIVGDAMGRPLAEALEQPDCPRPPLAVVASAGAVFSDAVKAQLLASLPNLTMLDNFGASETGSQGSMGGLTEDGGLRFTVDSNTVVLDDDQRIIPPGGDQTGLVARRGRVPVGYYKDPEKTAATFPTIDGVRYAVLGDVARYESETSIVVYGRGSLCINSGGEKIFPDEVERALKLHPQVRDALVVGIPDERWGQRVAAVVEAVAGTQPAADALVAHCREHIAGYKVPRQICFADTVQRAPSGKPDYPWAREQLLAADS